MTEEPYVDHALVTVDVPGPIDRDAPIVVPWEELEERLAKVMRTEGITFGERRLVIGLAVEMMPMSSAPSRLAQEAAASTAAPWWLVREATASTALDHDPEYGTHSVEEV